MLVETYEVEKIDQTEMQALAADGEAALLIEQLGLQGQKTLMAPETKELIPYRVMTKEEHIEVEGLLADVPSYVKGCFANGEAPTPHFYK